MISPQYNLYLMVQKVKNCTFFLACVASVSVWIRSKERQKNHEKRIFVRSLTLVPCYLLRNRTKMLPTQGNVSSLDQKLLPTNLISLCLSPHQYFVLRVC